MIDELHSYRGVFGSQYYQPVAPATTDLPTALHPSSFSAPRPSPIPRTGVAAIGDKVTTHGERRAAGEQTPLPGGER